MTMGNFSHVGHISFCFCGFPTNGQSHSFFFSFFFFFSLGPCDQPPYRFGPPNLAGLVWIPTLWAGPSIAPGWRPSILVGYKSFSLLLTMFVFSH